MYQDTVDVLIPGFLGVTSMLLVSLHGKLHLALAVLSLTTGSAGVAIADVTIDACVAQNSIIHRSLASDMQSLCSLTSSIGALVGFTISGIFVHLIGPKVTILFDNIVQNLLQNHVLPHNSKIFVGSLWLAGNSSHACILSRNFAR